MIKNKIGIILSDERTHDLFGSNWIISETGNTALHAFLFLKDPNCIQTLKICSFKKRDKHLILLERGETLIPVLSSS